VVVADLAGLPERDGQPLGADEVPGAVTWTEWETIDEAEVELGRARDAARQKLATWEVLLKTANQADEPTPEE
jgi:hypothetical protein